MNNECRKVSPQREIALDRSTILKTRRFGQKLSSMPYAPKRQRPPKTQVLISLYLPSGRPRKRAPEKTAEHRRRGTKMFSPSGRPTPPLYSTQTVWVPLDACFSACFSREKILMRDAPTRPMLVIQARNTVVEPEAGGAGAEGDEAATGLRNDLCRKHKYYIYIYSYIHTYHMNILERMML